MMSSAKASPSKFLIWKDILALAFRRPWVAIGFLVIQFLVVIVSYYTDLGIEQTLILAGVFGLVWLVIFIGIPAIWQIIVGLFMLILMGGLAYLVYQAFDNEGLLFVLLAVGLGILLAFIVLALIYLMLYLIPGILVGMAVYQITDNSTYAIIAMVISTILLLVLMTFIFKFLLPFLWRFSWTFFTYGLANQVAIVIVLGTEASEIMQESSTITNNMTDLTSLGERLLNLMVSLFNMPFVLKSWAIVISLTIGIIFLSPKLLGKK
jgi:hypothetical protein